MIVDIEELFKTIGGSSHLKLRKDFHGYTEKYPFINEFTNELLSNKTINDKKSFNKIYTALHKKWKPVDKIKNSIMIYHFKTLYTKNQISYETLTRFESYLRAKNCRSLSGILEVAIMTGPGEFSCNWDCYYCPNQEGFARSYIKEEPAVRRAAQNNFDPVLQIYDRLSAYSLNGHPIDKLEIIVLGGTWSNYPDKYQYEFIRDIYYAANTFFISNNRREKLSLEQEKTINETTLCKIIGLTLETRPDCINKDEILKFASYGVTRVQIGIQHTDDSILKKINRGCYMKDTQQAIRILKDNGFKILGHLMPNLPGSNPLKDNIMFEEMLYNPDNQIDEWKIYPTSITKTSEKDDTEVYTVIEKWYKNGKYIPYSEEELIELIIDLKKKIHPWIRISRIFRDIPTHNIEAGAKTPHMRQVCQDKLKSQGYTCNCIKCREIKSIDICIDSIVINVDSYESSNGLEYFISAQTKDKQNIIGFLRLRIPPKYPIQYIPEIKNCALVRELHVYGQMVPTYLKNNKNNTQHKGIGKILLKKAETIAQENNLNKVAIISGIGVRKYYEKHGYRLDGTFMVKHLHNYYYFIILIRVLIICVMFLLGSLS